jgi:L,D-peptidoglycan transpeptidase YkuD (ErfK/YbiS/YcfS/YnhG family)
MEITVRAPGILTWGGEEHRCALGRSGIRLDKREGDGATPAGHFALRRVLYRADRLTQPVTRLPCRPLTPNDGWCDDPADANYNRPVRSPYPASHEALWRDDNLYDVIVVLNHNYDPIVAGLGSAIFMHVAAPDFAPTAGCVALPLPVLLKLLKEARTPPVLTVQP